MIPSGNYLLTLLLLFQLLWPRKKKKLLALLTLKQQINQILSECFWVSISQNKDYVS